jgi:hypothetical protein
MAGNELPEINPVMLDPARAGLNLNPRAESLSPGPLPGRAGGRSGSKASFGARFTPLLTSRIARRASLFSPEGRYTQPDGFQPRASTTSTSYLFIFLSFIRSTLAVCRRGRFC